MTKLFHISLALCLAFAFTTGQAEESSSPETVVTKLHNSLIQSMKDAETQDYASRYKFLEPIVLNSFDFPTIARVVMGRHWKKLDDDQKTQFIDAFSKLSIATYTSQFSSYSGQSFHYLSDESMKKGRFLVKTQLTTHDQVIPFNYILQPGDDNWRIINVIANGVSDLSLKKSDYAAIMKTEGFDTLVRKLLEKVEASGK